MKTWQILNYNGNLTQSFCSVFVVKYKIEVKGQHYYQ